MNKHRVIGIVAVIVALVALTGCDAILEIFYPEYGDQFGGNNNAIGIYVEVQGTDYYGNPLIAAAIENVNGGAWIQVSSVWPYWNWDSSGNLYFTAYIEFFDVPPGDYYVVVWLDEDANQLFDYEEPWRDAVWLGQNGNANTIFSFPNTQGVTRIEGNAIF